MLTTELCLIPLDLCHAVQGHLLQRVSQPEGQAAAILWLASNASTFITGTALDIEGGAILKNDAWPSS